MRAISEITSDWAKTTQVEAMDTGSSAWREMSPRSSMGISSRSAMTSRNLPVPAAHLSFMTKSAMTPSASREMALLSWPPMSMMVRTVPSWEPSHAAPRALALISLIDSSASSRARRP